MNINREKAWDYLILTARVLLAWTFISYGWAKLTGDQFGISPEQQLMPVKELGLFKLSWYLFDQQPFKAFIGVSQIIAALLLLYNRTLILGALMSLPILVNILIIDITYVKMTGFYWRLSFYILLVFLILWHYRERMVAAFKTVTSGLTTKFKYPLWAYLILPVMAVLLEVASWLPHMIYGFIFDTRNTIAGFGWLFAMVRKFFGQFF